MVNSDAGLSQKIREYYNQKYTEWGTDCRSTIHDPNERRLEIKTILKYVKQSDRLLDVGCGNGYTGVQIAKRYNVEYIGIDFSEQMILTAQQQAINRDKLKGNMIFKVASVLDLPFEDNSFGKVLTERCLINLPSWEEQKKAILEIGRVLRPDGVFLMMESFLDGLSTINTMRRKFCLPEITMKWFNCYFEESKLLEFTKKYFSLVEINYFNSTYYALTRALWPAFLRLFNKQPTFESKINRAMSFLPNIGKFGYIRIYVFKKI